MRKPAEGSSTFGGVSKTWEENNWVDLKNIDY